MCVIPNAEPGSEAEIVELRKRRFINVAGIEERHDAEIADSYPRLQRELGEASPSDRVVEDRVARTQPLEAVAAHRPATPGIEAPRWGEPGAGAAQKTAQQGSAGERPPAGPRPLEDAVDTRPPIKAGAPVARRPGRQTGAQGGHPRKPA